MYNRSLLYVLTCFCIPETHNLFSVLFFSSTFFFYFFFLFLRLFFSIIFISCNFAKHTPWQYLRLMQWMIRLKRFTRIYKFVSWLILFFPFLFLLFTFIATIQFSFFIFLILSVSLTHSSLMNINYTHTSFSRFIYTCMYKDILLQWGHQRAARFLFLRRYLSIYFSLYVHRTLHVKENGSVRIVRMYIRWITGHTAL